MSTACFCCCQASAAASLALLSARDGVVQDSLRYLGGIPLLVGLLTSTQPNVAEAARCEPDVLQCALKRSNCAIEAVFAIAQCLF